MSEIPFSLNAFLPKKDFGVKVEIREELAPIVERMSTILPPNVLWELFSSDPAATGKKIVFPYLRVDHAVINARDVVLRLKNKGDIMLPEEYQERYEKGSRQAFAALLWVEIGFQGLENLAKSSASTNWTAGYNNDPDERAKGIMTTGKEMFDKCLKEFVEFRQKKGIKDDYFSQYGVEYLLDSFLK
ncbi:hypothetical protein L6272_00940 [Microgenomates group bacterium]|nr:hypothetical protein [Microgenomates group bacterium]MDZ7586666.1 hypothetical protein [Patescibacteria group bacterium]